MKRTLFYGGSSLLAQMWYNELEDKSKVILTQHKQKLSITNSNIVDINNTSIESTIKLIEENQIEILVNCVGLTNVEQCELDKKNSILLNAEIPSILSKACNETKTKLVHISTDHLFNGQKSFYSEIDKTSPLNEYARSKLIGDINVIDSNKNALIIRSNFFGKGPKHRASFSDFIINSLAENKIIELFDDVFYSPIIINELVRVVNQLLSSDKSGIYNVVSSEKISKYDFGKLIEKNLNLKKGLIKKAKIEKRRDLALRPKDMSLSNKKIQDELNINIIPIEKQIKLLNVY